MGVRKCDLQCPCTAPTGKAAFRMAVPAVSAWGLSSALVSAFQASWEWGEGGLGVSSELIELPAEKLPVGGRAKAVFLP